jgi:hypothetical protein
MTELVPYNREYPWVSEWYYQTNPPTRENLSQTDGEGIHNQDPHINTLYKSLRNRDLSHWIEFRKSEERWFQFMYNSMMMYYMIDWCAFYGFLEGLQFFINNGQSVRGLYSALKQALSNGHIDCAIYLREQGAIWSDKETIKYIVEWKSKEGLRFAIQHQCPIFIDKRWDAFKDSSLLYDPEFRSYWLSQDWSSCTELNSYFSTLKRELELTLQYIPLILEYKLPRDIINFVIAKYV